ncbi:MAG: methylmalonyl-CoA mutase [Desulfobacterales bacterium]|nr:methylmalonyl-CoA mutase [Desulfobacterales bacterium]
MIKLTGKSANKFIGVHYINSWYDDSPGMATVRDIAEKYQPGKGLLVPLTGWKETKEQAEVENLGEVVTMADENSVNKVREMEEEWQKNYTEKYEKKPGFKIPESHTESGISLKPVYTPSDVADIDYSEIGMPGSYPYTRGLYPLTYQYQRWMTQQIHGYARAEDTRKRTEKLTKEGMKGFVGAVLFIVPDLASAYGYDPDDEAAKGMVGLSGASVNTEEDIRIICDGYDLSKTRVGFSTKITCLPMLAIYLVYAERQGYKPNQLIGQSQNRRKIAWLGQNMRDHPPKDQLKLQVELIKYCVENVPRWNHTNLCGYVAGENCASPAQEMAFMLSEAIELIECGIKASIKPDDMIPRFSAQMHMGMDFFEEICKLRAFRKMWAKTMKERFGCEKAASQQFRIHVHTGGINLTAQQPLNNITRTTLQVLASVLGGTQSIHTSSYDEAISLPSEDAATTSLRVNQIILHESGMAKVCDPLGGSYYVEWLTERLEREAWKIVDEIESRGGYTRCMETGWLWNLLDQRIKTWRQEVDQGERVIVGVNKYRQEEAMEVPEFTVDQEEIERLAIERIKKWKQSRDQSEVKRTLKGIEEAVRRYESVEQAGGVMPALIDAAEARCTLGEMTDVFFQVYGQAYPC